ncbi:Rne/Rng family ribonuclease [Parasedimentitalea maritima]|uniref:Ribonuclease E n=1 Tax=Parasedimentitalea maritima TaxID=2578117 RepID=A0ABY2UUQ0_9RHOB|nr:ribonuclease E/G [Zongyanglinia marina]TLP64418.1 Rne/Rng family ribonuclease [Zongyanglinia marina]
MAKKMLIDATHAEETRVVVVDGNKVEEFDFESENRRQLAGNIYLAKVTRVEPSLQAAFVDYGGNRHGFLAFSEIHPDYYQIPVADREALMEEERAYAEQMRAKDDEEESKPSKPRRSRSRSRTKAEGVKSKDAVETKEVETATPEISGMETIDLSDEGEASAVDVLGVSEGSSPMETVAETPVEEPADDQPESAAEEVNPDAEAVAAGAEPTEVASAPAEVEVAVETAVKSDEAVEEQTVTTTVAEAIAEAVAIATEADPAEEKAVEAKEPGSDEPDAEEQRADATSKDSSIESVAEEDDSEDIRPRRKPRPRRYKIQEVIKVRQILLVQVVKEERGNKGAALTTYLSLAGRYCVLMPNTARGGGISRKITNAVDRKKLKEIAHEIDVPQGAGLIVRTAGAKRTKAEIKRDYEYLQRLWEQIRELTLKSIAPAKIYEEGDLIKRSIRDLYNREIDEVFVEGERGYRIAKDFMKMIMPSHAKNVKRYNETLPLFARYQVESYLGGMFNPTVQLKSGGYIVIDVTEALVAIDVNSGRATKEGSIEDTATKTNLEAAEEVARQLRLRDLAGLIVIDFIDMDERKNNAAVEKRIKDKLKTDRARIQIGRISGFGLMEMSRQRLRPGMLEATTQPCPSCHGTGLIRSDDNMALTILRQIEEEGTRGRSREVLVRCPVSIANFLMNQKREHIAQIEARYGLSVRIEGDPHLVSPDFTLEKLKTATRAVPVAAAPVVSVDTSLMDQVDADEAETTNDEETVVESSGAAEETETSEEDVKPKRKRRRRRRRSGKSDAAENGSDTDTTDAESKTPVEGDEATKADDGATEVEPAADEEKKPAKRTRSRSRSRGGKAKSEVTESPDTVTSEAQAETEVKVESSDVEQVTPVVSEPETADVDTSSSVAPEASEEIVVAAEPTDQAEPVVEPVASSEDQATTESVVEPVEEVKEPVTPELAVEETAIEPEVTEPVEAEPVSEPAETQREAEPALVAAEQVAPEPEEPPKPKRRGWWSLGS